MINDAGESLVMYPNSTHVERGFMAVPLEREAAL